MDTKYETLFAAARRAGTELARTDAATLGRAVTTAARLLRTHADSLLEANALDLAAMAADSPLRDRLRLTPERIAGIASDMEAVAGLPAPQGTTIDEWTRPNGLSIRKVRVPFGVVGMICEARPNVTADIFSLCLRTGNACVLKGGSDARRSNEAIAALLHEALRSEGIDPAAFTLLPSDHEAVAALLGAVGYVDVVIPRGGAGLIRFVRENAHIPVIETGAGIVHTYFDADGDLAKGRAVICNAKTRRVSVCNALDCLVVHRSRLGELAELCDPMAAERVTVYADAEAYAALAGRYPAPPRRSISAPSSLTTNWRSKPSVRSTKPWPTSNATPRATARRSSPRMRRRRGCSRSGPTRRASMSTSRRPSPTEASSDSAPRSESRPRSSTPGARWGFPNSRPTSTSFRATGRPGTPEMQFR